MTARIASLRTYDIRFPTSRDLDGSDAMNPDPDYSASYVVLGTDHPDGHGGHGFAFTIGRGNDIQTTAIRALEPYVDANQRWDVGQAIAWVRELIHPVVIRNGNYLAPTAPGFSADLRPQTLIDYAFPDGPVWGEGKAA
ncbi:hypothetical protein [Micromonospora sp. 067-2]|uniref:hypothetical protein n=1 Tax=Micromonospora sp. 067-2 TaxID=2789270 RepID=UPI003978B22A